MAASTQACARPRCGIAAKESGASTAVDEVEAAGVELVEGVVIRRFHTQTTVSSPEGRSEARA